MPELQILESNNKYIPLHKLTKTLDRTPNLTIWQKKKINIFKVSDEILNCKNDNIKNLNEISNSNTKQGNIIKVKKNKKHKNSNGKCEKTNKFHNYDDIIMIRDVELIKIIKNADLTSRYIIEQYLKNKNIMIDNNSILRITTDTKEYYKLKDEIIKLKLCYRCNCYIKIKYIENEHHIIPIKNSGDNSEYNKIFLCKKCHDYVEDETSKLYENSKNPSVNELKTYIRTDFPA